MHRLWTFGVEILHAERGAVEADFPQCGDMVAGEPAWINLHARLDITRESEVFVDQVAELADFVGRQKCWRAAAPMKLDDLSAWIDQSAHLADFPVQVAEIRITLAVIEGDDCGAAAKPTKRLAEWDMEIE